MGTFLAIASGYFSWIVFVLSILTTIFLQVLSNLANDYGDAVHGADTAGRKGPARAVQSGSISSAKMKTAVVIFAGLAFVSGVALLFVSIGFNWKALLFFLALGILSIGAAISYTVGRRPYGYAGLGDLSVLIFFGFVGVMGSFYLQTGYISPIEIFPSISCGLFAIGVLNINNIRDIESDRKAGKLSIPVRIGRTRAVLYHWTLIILGLISTGIYTFVTYQSGWQLLFLFSLPLFIANGMAVSRKSPEHLDPYLRQLALSTLLFVVTFGAGLIFSGID